MVIPKEIQLRIQTQFSAAQQAEMIKLAQALLEKERSWGLPSRLVLESLLTIAQGDIANLKKLFPVYDARDIVMQAQQMDRDKRGN